MDRDGGDRHGDQPSVTVDGVDGQLSVTADTRDGQADSVTDSVTRDCPSRRTVTTVTDDIMSMDEILAAVRHGGQELSADGQRDGQGRTGSGQLSVWSTTVMVEVAVTVVTASAMIALFVGVTFLVASR